RAAGATERLLELLHAAPAVLETSQPEEIIDTRSARISFNHVSFYYPSRLQTAALSDVSLEIPSGETVALIGPSGAGKTTLLQLLLRFYDVTAGSIRINGQDIRKLSLQSLRSMIAVV